jgi:hypothetical protein
MRGDERRALPQARVLRKKDVFRLGREELPQLGRHLVVRHQQSHVRADQDEMPVEEPVGRRRSRNAVLDDVRTAIGDRKDVSGLQIDRRR